MHELISIEKSKLLPIAAAIAMLAAANWANTTRQYFFELNHDLSIIAWASTEERASWSELDGAIYKSEYGRVLYSSSPSLVGPPAEATHLPLCRMILNLPESATTRDVSKLIETRVSDFKATGCSDSTKEAMAILGVRKPIETKLLINRLHYLDSALVKFGDAPRYAQVKGTPHRKSHFKLLNDLQEQSILRAKQIDDLTFGLL